jgi:hypothetical protein
MDMGYESESVKAQTISIILRKQNSYSKKDKRRETGKVYFGWKRFIL